MMLIGLAIAAGLVFAALRLQARKERPILAISLYMVAVWFGIMVLSSLWLLAKAKTG
jgi:predicted membrane channel-forming protein YqfA (hemolysin III family)